MSDAVGAVWAAGGGGGVWDWVGVEGSEGVVELGGIVGFETPPPPRPRDEAGGEGGKGRGVGLGATLYSPRCDWLFLIWGEWRPWVRGHEHE